METMKAWRVPFVIGSTARLAYGLGAVFAPEWMDGRLAPRILGHPDPRMNLRGFGGAQSGVALYTLMASSTPGCAERNAAQPARRRSRLRRLAAGAARPWRVRPRGYRRSRLQHHRAYL